MRVSGVGLRTSCLMQFCHQRFVQVFRSVRALTVVYLTRVWERRVQSVNFAAAAGRAQEAPQGNLLETHASKLAGDAVKVSHRV